MYCHGRFVPVKKFDNFDASSLQGSVDVALMPGQFDPSNHFLPQQPLHRCMFPQSGTMSTFTRATNPFHYDIDGVRCVHLVLQDFLCRPCVSRHLVRFFTDIYNNIYIIYIYILCIYIIYILVNGYIYICIHYIHIH